MFVVDFYGPYACFTPPYAKVERMTLPVPTPGVVRNMLQAIYGKPSEFWWQVVRIEIMNPIKYYTCKRNEVELKMSARGSFGHLDVSKCRTQHTSVLLKDVRYRVTARPVVRDPALRDAVCCQAARRIESGQCFVQPYFGIREYEAYFEPADMSAVPEPIELQLGLLTYDTHDPSAHQPGYSGMDLSLFQCEVHGGVIEVPAWGDSRILTVGGGGRVAQGIV